MKIDFAVVCDYAILDRFGKLSVLGIYQHVWVGNFPAVHPRTHLVLRLKGSRTEIGQHSVEIRFVDDSGESLINGSGTVTFNEPPAGVTEIEAGAVLVFDIPLPQPGRYRFEISVDDSLETTVPLTASESPSRQQGSQPGFEN